MKENRLNKLKKFLKENFKKGIQAFDTRNIVGDNNCRSWRLSK